MTKALKQLIHVLWAIEKDLHVIASNWEVLSEKEALFLATRDTPNDSELKISYPLIFLRKESD